MEMNEIKVGSKWKHNDFIYEVLENYNDDVLVITKNKGDKQCVFKKWFENISTPYVEFEWRTFRNINIDFIKSYGDKEIIGQYINPNFKPHDIKQYELLYNYNRYRELVDTDKTDVYGRVYSISPKNDFIYTVFEEDITLGEMYFSSEEHAKAFLKLVKENDCL